MPRDSNGTYTKPFADVEGGTPITSTWANGTINDLETAMTNSLSRDGDGGMRVPFQNASGDAGAPGITFVDDTISGMFLVNTSDVRISIAGTEVFRWTSSLVQLKNGPDWVNMVSKLDLPDGSNNGDIPVWDGSKWAPQPQSPNTGTGTSYDNSTSGLAATNVQDAIDEVDGLVDTNTANIATNAANIATNTSNIATNTSDIATKADTSALNAHTGNSSIHFTVGSIDHGSIAGLTGDDHTQYYNQSRGDARYLQLGATAANSTKWGNYNVVVGAAGGDANTIYFVPE